jgi:hypothetical protein
LLPRGIGGIIRVWMTRRSESSWTTLADIRADVFRIRQEIVDDNGEEEEEEDR